MRKLCLIATGLVLAAGSPARAEFVEFYVGFDGRAEPFSSPAAPVGDGLSYADNPNHNRLTFLYSHPNEGNPAGNHYHGIGAYTYTGPSTSAVLDDTNSNNRIPEGYTGQAPLALSAGSGMYAGKLVSGAQSGVHYSDLRIRSVDDLSGYAEGTPEHYMYHSSSDRWSGAMAGTNIQLELVSISPGLNVGSATEMNLFPGGVGTMFDLGAGDALDFTPVVWVDETATLGTYSVEFRLHDTGATDLGTSGRFYMDFQAVPEPSSIVLIVLGSLGCSVALLRRSRRSRATNASLAT